MTKTFWKRWCFNRTPLLFMPIMVLVLFALGFGLGCLMIATGEESTWLAIGVLMAEITPAMCSIFYALIFPQEFSLALSFGSTRKEFLMGYFLRQTLLLVLCFAGIFLLGKLEAALYPAVFPGITQEPGFTPMAIMTDLRILLPLCLYALILPPFLGSLVARFGKPVLWILYVVFLACTYSLPRILERPAVMEFLFSVPVYGWYILGAAAAAAMFIFTLLLARKQAVK